jgi:preprotein translocase subunit SecF
MPRRIWRAIRFTLKWSLAALGLYLVLGLAVIEFTERRIGLGHGFVAVLIVGTIRGVMSARTSGRPRHRDSQSF